MPTKKLNMNANIQSGSFVAELFDRSTTVKFARNALNVYAATFARYDEKGKVVPVEDGRLLLR